MNATLLVAALLAVAGLAEAGPRAPARAAAVEPEFDFGPRGRSPFPSDRLTVPDPAQRTGLRVALPVPDCAVAPSACDDVRLLDELDGFDLDPRLALPFSGPIDPTSVTPESVFLVRLAPGPPEAMGVERLVYDPDAHTLYAHPEALLEPETRYGLVVTRALRDPAGRSIRPSGRFQRLLAGRDGPSGPARYRRALLGLAAALGRRGVKPDAVAVASVFTTESVTSFLERARDALDREPPPPAVITAPDGGGRAYFPRATLARLVLRRQVRPADDPLKPGAGLEDGGRAFRETPLPLEALPDAVAGIGIGWYWSPSYLGRDRRIVEGPTARPAMAATAPVQLPVAFVVVVPAGTPPARGWPLAIFGHGYGGEMLSGTLLIAGTLARHGIATAAIDVVGHGGGPESRLVVTEADGRTRSVRVPGRGIDLDGDGRIEPAEGLAPLPSARLASLGLRDGVRQQVVDLMALVRAVRGGLDVDGDGRPGTGAGPIYYVGQSLGGIYGALFLAVEPGVRVGVLNVVGGPVGEIARLSPVFRPLLRAALGRRVPSLLNRDGEFQAGLPLRDEPAVVGLVPGAAAIQEYLARVEWLGRRGGPLAYARYLRAAPLPGLDRARVLVQFARGDRVVPNPTTSAFVRAGQLGDATSLLRYDRVASGVPAAWAEPHGFLLHVLGPGAVGTLARAGQEQVARFFLADGATVWDPDTAVPPPFSAPVFEVPAASLPDTLGFEPETERP